MAILPGSSPTLPNGSKPYGTQQYQAPDGAIWIGTSASGFFEVGKDIIVQEVKSTADTANAKADVAQEDIERVETEELPNKADNSNVALHTTIGEIRSFSGNLKTNTYYTTDIDQEGFWFYDSQDSTSVDNTGTVLVTSDGKRLKRIVIDGTVSAEMFGVKESNSASENSQSLQKMFNSGYTRFSAKENRIYNVDNTDLYFPSGTSINFNGTTLKCTKTSGNFIIGTRELITFQQSGLSISVIENSRSFVYSGSSSLTVGNFIWLKGQVYLTSGENTYENGWLARITSINNDIVTVSHAAPRSMTSTDIREYKCYENIDISNLILDMKGANNGFALALNYCFNSTISKCKAFSDNLSTSPEIGIYVIGINITISESQSDDFRFINTGAGYGFAVAGHSVTLDKCIGKGSKHVIQASGRLWFSSDINYLTCKATNGRAAGIDMHANILSGKIDGCTVDTTSQAFLVRSPNISFTNNTANLDNTTGNNVAGLVLYEGAGEGNYINNFTVKINGSNGASKAILGYQLSFPVRGLSIVNCPLLMGDIEMENGTTTVDSIFIENIKMVGTSTLQSRITLNSGATSYWIKDVEFLNNIPSSATFNYSINIAAVIGSQRGYINKNIFRVTNAANTSQQIRVATEFNEITDNTFYTNATSFINDLSTGKKNIFIRNINIDNTGAVTLISPASLPTASSFFENTSTLVLESGIRNQYTCVNIGSGSYAWVRTAYLEGKNNTFTNQNTFNDIVSTSDIRPRTNNSFNIGSSSLAYNLAYIRRIIGGLSAEDLEISSIGSNGILFSTASTGTRRGKLHGNGTWVFTDSGVLSDLDVNNKSIFTLNSTTRGQLPPRMTLAQRLAITPIIPIGLTLYQTDDITGYYEYESDGWRAIDAKIIDVSSTPYVRSTINSVYPNATRGVVIIQDNANMTYIKKDNSSTGNWSAIASVQLT